MSSESYAVPTLEEVHQAIELANGILIAKYAVAVQQHRNTLAKLKPQLIEAAANAKRDLDMNQAAIKNCDEIVKLCQSVLKTMRP